MWHEGCARCAQGVPCWAAGASSLPAPVGHPSTTREVVLVTARTAGDKDSIRRNRYVRAAQIVLPWLGDVKLASTC